MNMCVCICIEHLVYLTWKVYTCEWYVNSVLFHSKYCFSSCKSWDNSASIVAGLQAGQVGFSSQRGQNVSLHHIIHTGSEAHPSFSHLRTWVFSLVKFSRHGTNHSRLYSAEFKNVWNYLRVAHMSAWCGVKIKCH